MYNAVFLDRDGIINDLVDHDGKLTAPWDINEFKFKSDIQEAVFLLKNLKFKIFVVTNQPDVKDGWLLQSHLDLMTRMIYSWLRVDEISIAYERNKPDYKPNNMMVTELIKKYNIQIPRSFLIGDTWKDIVCGYRSELNTIYVGDKYICPDARFKFIKPDHIVNNILDAVKIIEETKYEVIL